MKKQNPSRDSGELGSHGCRIDARTHASRTLRLGINGMFNIRTILGGSGRLGMLQPLHTRSCRTQTVASDTHTSNGSHTARRPRPPQQSQIAQNTAVDFSKVRSERGDSRSAVGRQTACHIYELYPQTAQHA
eukprot:1437399-Prymnesium_polylepis.2